MKRTIRKNLLDILIETSSQINDNTENLDELLSSIVTISNSYLQFKSISIFLKNDEEDTFVLRAFAGIKPYTDKIYCGKGLIGEAAEQGREVMESSFKSNDGEISALFSLPMKVRGKVTGIINLKKYTDKPFTKTEISAAKYMAVQSALIVDRHELYYQQKLNENLKRVGMLKSSLAHDIANLLGVVEVYMELLEAEVPRTPEIREYFEDIYTELKRASGLAADMLDYSKEKVRLNKTKFNVSSLVNELKRHNKLLIRDTNIEIEYKTTDGYMITADKNRMFRVLFNLINNSIDALHGKGKIIFKEKRCGNDVVFIVMDNGTGISKENINKLFQPFFTSGKAKGTGLGLAVVDGVVRAHGGKVSVRSTEGQYTCFVVRIPIND